MFTERIDYFENLAHLHKLVLHGVVVTNADAADETRRSFISVTDPEAELASAITNQLHYPLVVQMSFGGRLEYNEGGCSNLNTHTLYFLAKCPRPETGNFPAQLKAAYNTAEQIMRDFITRMQNDYEENGNCGPFGDIDLGSFQYSMTGYVADAAAGWKLTFTEKSLADDVLDFDPSKWND